MQAVLSTTLIRGIMRGQGGTIPQAPYHYGGSEGIQNNDCRPIGDFWQ